MKTIKEVSEITGVTTRTLRYYDELGLLKPAKVADNGYRYYDEKNLLSLQKIMFLRELDLPLKTIINVIKSDNQSDELLTRHKQLLIKKKERLEKIINLLDEQLKGEDTMNFDAFSEEEIDQMKKQYQQEAEERWGDTDAYKQSKEKTKNYTKEKWQVLQRESGEIFKAFADARGKEPADEVVQDLVQKWQNHIIENYYECTKEILAGLGQMYIADERFKKNLDQFGEGTAMLMSEAIAHYCK